MLPNDVAWYYLDWPWVGLGGAIVLVILAFSTDLLRSSKILPRLKDPCWVAWLPAIAYLIHNVEEYGVDAHGLLYAFPTAMRESFGEALPGVVLVAINLPMIWVVGPLTALLARRRVLTGTEMASFALVNAVVHVASAAKVGYNPGLLTAVVLFIPAGIWAYILYVKQNRPLAPLLLGSLGGAIAYHALLFGAINLTFRGVLSTGASAFFMIASAIVVMAIWLFAARYSASRE